MASCGTSQRATLDSGRSWTRVLCRLSSKTKRDGCSCNRALADRFGATPEEWVGKTDFETWPSEIAEEFQRSDRQALDANQEIHFEDRTLGLDGRTVTWDVHKYPFADADGRRSVACMALDVTSAWEAQQQVQRIQQELQTANERLQTLSLTDSLTGLMNRRAL
jgi:PAS domain S-box-containing protein